jgi:hypothetical protein
VRGEVEIFKVFDSGIAKDISLESYRVQQYINIFFPFPDFFLCIQPRCGTSDEYVVKVKGVIVIDDQWSVNGKNGRR